MCALPAAGRLNASADDILALNAQELQGYLQSDPVLALDGCAGKIVAGFTWRYVGVCTAKQGEKLLGQNGKPLSTAVEISFPGQVENSLKATVTEVEIDQDSGLARFVLACNSINGDVLCLNRAAARISVGERSGLRVPAAAVHYLKRGWHRGTNAGRELCSRCLRETWQHRPLLPDRPGGCRPSADHRR